VKWGKGGMGKYFVYNVIMMHLKEELKAMKKKDHERKIFNIVEIGVNIYW
jgi:hypothetical protein